MNVQKQERTTEILITHCVVGNTNECFFTVSVLVFYAFFFGIVK